jgi:N-methylhydantoinase B
MDESSKSSIPIVSTASDELRDRSKVMDPIRFEVIRNALVASTEEMAVALRRSAYSTNVKTRSDFSCAFFDRNLRVTAQAFTQPVHLGSFVELVPRAVRTYGFDRLGVGDMLVTNDPFNGGVHLNDITVIAPVFTDDEFIGCFASLVHHVDVGGGAPASIGAFQEIYQEGVIIPVVKLVSGGAINEDIFNLMLAQMRAKRETAGDFRAQIAANVTGERRLKELVHRIGTAELNFYIDELIDYTHRRTESEIRKLPKGTFTADGEVDNDGFTDQSVKLHVTVTIDEASVTFDLTGSDQQRRGPVNSTFAMTFSGCAYVLKCLIDQDVPVNQGFYDFVNVIAPQGTVTNCIAPAAVVGGWETQTRLVDVIFKALAPAIPERALAGTKAMMCQAGFGGIDPRTGEYYCFYEALAGGYGGRNGKDGPDAVQAHGQNTENAPVEEIEINYPVEIPRYELIPDTGGPGRWRGGLGLRRDYRFPDHEASFTILADRDRKGPWGLYGGQEGERAEYVLNPDGAATRLPSKTTVHLQPGDVVSFRTCGGGGFGPSSERDRDALADDVRNGKLTAEHAWERYQFEPIPSDLEVSGEGESRESSASALRDSEVGLP